MTRRGRRKKITYDSGESKILFGLAFLVLSIISFLSNMTDGVVFDFFHNLFGGATTFFGITFLAVSIRFFNPGFDKINWKTVIGLLLISIAYATFLSGDVGLPSNARNMALKGEYGGRVGFEIAELIGDYFFRNAIKPGMLLVIFFSIPLVISMTFGEYLDLLGKAVEKVINLFKRIGEFINHKEADPEVEEEAILNDGVIPTMVGDFSSGKKEGLIKDKKEEKASDQKKSEVNEQDTFSGIADGQSLDGVRGKNDIHFRESKQGENAFMQEELKFPDWTFPPIELLKAGKKVKPSVTGIKRTSRIIEQTLMSFGVKAEVVDVLVGPSVTQYALNIALGTKVSKIANLRNDLALALATPANSVRIEAPIPGTSFVGIEVPNKEREMITFRELVEDDQINGGILTVTLGKDVSGANVFADIQKLPHLLIAGATGSGKSVVTNSFIMSLLMKKSPDEVRLILVDPKQVEFSDYNGIPHLLTPVITDMNKVNNALKWAIVEMERRYTTFRESRVRNIEDFNGKMGFSALPYIVIVIDEMADMMMTQNGPEIESSIVKLAQKARATGIHLILATQRPSVDVITGLIKANIPGRLGMSVTTQIDSRVILDQIGAESLLGRGDALYKDPGKSRLERIQAGFISQEEVAKVVEWTKAQLEDEVEYSLEVTKTQVDPNSPEGANESLQFSDDELFVQAARVVINARKGSSSLIQRKLSVGYNRAARLLDELCDKGIVGPANGSKPRDILVSDLDAYLASGALNQNEEEY